MAICGIFTASTDWWLLSLHFLHFWRIISVWLCGKGVGGIKVAKLLVNIRLFALDDITHLYRWCVGNVRALHFAPPFRLRSYRVPSRCSSRHSISLWAMSLHVFAPICIRRAKALMVVGLLSRTISDSTSQYHQGKFISLVLFPVLWISRKGLFEWRYLG